MEHRWSLHMGPTTMKPLLLLIALGFAGAVPLQDDDSLCEPHSRPWHVNLNGAERCSGALIDRWWIVTSFLCSYSSSSFTASLGDYDITVEEGTEQHIQTDLIIRHGPYRSPLHSLAMVRLAKPAQFNQYVQPIPLPSSCPPPGQSCHVSGWGSTIPNQYEPSKKMKCISVPVVADKICRDLFPMYWSDGMVCAGQVDKNKNCLSDSSSVMVCDGQLQGIHWYNHGCKSPPNPSTYTKICKYTSWIKDIMRSNSPTLPPPTTLPVKENEDAEGLK